jgi:hypothetical protein
MTETVPNPFEDSGTLTDTGSLRAIQAFARTLKITGKTELSQKVKDWCSNPIKNECPLEITECGQVILDVPDTPPVPGQQEFDFDESGSAGYYDQRQENAAKEVELKPVADVNPIVDAIKAVEAESPHSDLSPPSEHPEDYEFLAGEDPELDGHPQWGTDS